MDQWYKSAATRYINDKGNNKSDHRKTSGSNKGQKRMVKRLYMGSGWVTNYCQIHYT